MEHLDTLKKTIKKNVLPSLILDENNTILAINDLGEQFLGYTEEELQGASFDDLVVRHFYDEEDADDTSNSVSTLIVLNTKNSKSVLTLVSEEQFVIGNLHTRLILLNKLDLPRVKHCVQEFRRHQNAIQTWEVAVYEHNHLNNVIYGSSRLREMYGFDPHEELTVEMFANATHPDDSEWLYKAIMDSHDPRGDGVFNVIHRIIRADGSIRWLHTRAQSKFGKVDGKDVCLLTTGSAMDITERQDLAIDLQRNEQRLSEAIRASNVGIFERDHNASRNAVYWSDTFYDVVGVEKTQQPNDTWFNSRIHGDDVAHVKTVSQAPPDEADGQYEVGFRWHHPDGSTRSLLKRATTQFSVTDGKRQRIRTVGALLDVTEQKAIQKEKQRQMEILDATPDFVGMAEYPSSRLYYLNRAGRRFLGLTPDEGLEDRTISIVHPKETLRVILNIGIPSAVKDGSWIGETEFVKYDGTCVPMSQVILVNRDDDGRVTHISTIARDLSREKILEEQFRQAQKLEAIGQLAGGIAHDFNNLLSAIAGFTELATLRIDRDHVAQKYLDQVLRAAERSSSLTHQLLAFSRKQVMQPRVVDVNLILLGTERMLRRLLNERIELTVFTAPNAVNIKADPNQMDQILLNLVVNARDAMPDGGAIVIEASQVLIDDDKAAERLDLKRGLYVTISVSDTGEGMDDETRKRIFEPFFTTKGPGQGTGLGLAMVFGIVKQSSGSIWAYSEPGKGTTFKLYFPSTDEPITVPHLSKPKMRSRRGGVIMVTEDDYQLREMVTCSLKDAGYEVLSAENPSVALDKAKEFDGNIDLLLTDVLMPIMTGKQLADTLLEDRPTLKILYMSGYAENVIVHHGVLDKDVNFISKPVTPRRLVEAIEEILKD